MNYPVDVSELPSIAHMNRPQKRALILRDQLKFLDVKHLDTFLAGIGDPEPPNYKFINGRLHPPFAEVTLKEGATRLDLGNVQFTEGQHQRISRVHFMIENGNCEMSESDALPEKDDDLNSVPVHVFIARQMISLFMKKFEAIDMRKCSLNSLRRAARDGLNQQKIRINPGKSLARLSPEGTARDGSSSNGRDIRKRIVGEPIPRHVANKRQCIGLDEIPDTAKSVIFDSIPEKVKIDLFNNIVKTALPNFDNLMTAAWNVVYVHKNVGSEDRELYKSITCLEKVLLETATFHRKFKMNMEPREKNQREQVFPQNGHQRVSPGSTTASSPTGARNDDLHNRQQIHVVQTAHDDEEDAGEDVVRNAPHNRRNDSRNGRYAPEYQVQNESTSAQRTLEQDEPLVRKRAPLEKMRDPLTYAKNSSSNGGSMRYPREDTPRRTMVDDGSSLYDNEQSQHEQQRNINSNRDLRKHQPQDQHYPTSTQKPARTTKPARDPHRQIYTDGLDDYFEDTKQEPRASVVERPAPPPAPAVFLGHSKLGAPKVPPNAMGFAPVAPMMHIRKEDEGERNGH